MSPDTLPFQSNKFYSLFAKLSKKEKKEFATFLQAFYSDRQVILKVFNYFLENHEKKGARHWKKPYILKTLFPSNQYKDKEKHFHNQLSILKGMLDEYLLWQRIKKDSFEKDFSLLQIYREKQLYNLYSKSLNRLQKKEQNKTRKGMDDYLHQMQLAAEAFYHTSTTKLELKNNPLKQAIDHLFNFFSAATLKFACEVKNRKNIVQESFFLPFQDEILNRPYKKESQAFHIIYQRFYEYLKSDNKEDFTNFVQFFQDRSDSIPTEDAVILFTYLLNTGIRFSRSGDLAFIKIVHELHKEGLKKRFLWQKSAPSSTKFFNIIDFAGKAGDGEWAADFITDYLPLLPKKERKDAHKLGKATLFFTQKKQEQVIDELIHLDYVNSKQEFALRAQVLRLCAQYEMDKHSNLLLPYCTNFRAWLNRNEVLGDDIIKGSINFISIVQLLVKAQKDPDFIRKKLNDFHLIYMKSWLNEKLDDYKSIYK